MFNWTLWIGLTVLCMPGIWLMSVHTGKELYGKPGIGASRQALTISVAAQTAGIVALCAAAGIYFGPKIGLSDRFLTGLTNAERLPVNLITQLAAGLVAGVVCSVSWIAIYYGFVRPRLDPETVRISEKMRNTLGLWTRIASGGVMEEVIFRWGLLAAAMWGLTQLGMPDTPAFWVGIAATGILFGLAHLPGNLQAGCKPSVLFVTTAVLGNLWVSLFCGYLFWRYGFIAAVVAHVLFHVLWYPWDRAYKKPITNDASQ